VLHPRRVTQVEQRVGWVERKRNPSPLAEAAVQRIARTDRPSGGLAAEPHHAMERRKWPILDALHIAVLDRIEVNVVRVPCKIVVVVDRVLPEAALPDAAFALARAVSQNALGECSRRENVVLMSRQRVEKSRSPAGNVHNA